jgi:hypothetical protein
VRTTKAIGKTAAPSKPQTLADTGLHMYRVLAPLLLVAVLGCDGHTTFSGRIVDVDGKPIPGAKVTVTQDGHRVGIEQESDADGAFYVGGTHAPSHDPLDFQVHKNGYVDDSRRVPPESTGNMRIVLERENPLDAAPK